jgi:hypothetical protein
LTTPPQLVYNWDQVDTPPIFHALDSIQGQEIDFMARRQLLQEIYRKIRAPSELGTQNTPVSIAAMITLQKDGVVAIDRISLVNPEAPMYTDPDDSDQIEVWIGGSSHPNYDLLERIRKDPAFRASRAQKIYRDALLRVEKSLRALPTFSPAIKDGEQVSVSRTLTFLMRPDFD